MGKEVRLSRTFVIADLHFGHAGVCKFQDGEGNPLRPWDDPKEMDEALIDKWNSVVAPADRVYVLGDLAINRKAIPTVGCCNGRKVLVKGNHDIFKLKDYLPFFDDIRAYVVQPKNGIIMSHIPIHPQNMERWKLNIHGHTHSWSLDDTKYRCVSVEQIGFKPLDLQEIIDAIQ